MAFTEGSMQFVIADALRTYSQDFRWLDAVAKPYRFALNGRPYSVHASDTHFANRDNPDEWRIQIPTFVREQQAIRAAGGDVILFLGFFDDAPVFTGWEPEYVLSLNFMDVGSVYVPHSDAGRTLTNMVAQTVSPARNLGRTTAKITLRNEFLGFYAENAAALHASRDEAELAGAIATFRDFIERPAGAGDATAEPELGGTRQKVTATRTAYPRDPGFRDKVMRAYCNSCCICGRQLGLIEAAHIVPHAHPACTNDVSNGLALCVEHHRMYDDALLLPGPGGILTINERRVEHLRNIGQDAGIDALRTLAAGGYRAPKNVQSRPDDGFLERGARIRLGTDA